MGAARLAGQCWEAQHGMGSFLMLEMAARLRCFIEDAGLEPLLLMAD